MNGWMIFLSLLSAASCAFSYYCLYQWNESRKHHRGAEHKLAQLRWLVSQGPEKLKTTSGMIDKDNYTTLASMGWWAPSSTTAEKETT